MPLRAHARRYISGSGFLFAVWVRVVLWWAGGIIGPEWGGPSAKCGEEGETESQTHRRSGKGRRAEGGCRARAPHSQRARVTEVVEQGTKPRRGRAVVPAQKRELGLHRKVGELLLWGRRVADDVGIGL